MKCLWFEPARTERFRESFECRRTNRLRAVEGDFPTTQIQLRALLFSHLARAQIVSEVWPAAGRRLDRRNRLCPARRALQKRRRRHERTTRADEQCLQHVSDQSHVVITRQPTDDDRRFCLVKRL